MAAGTELRRTLEQSTDGNPKASPFGALNESDPFGYINEADPFGGDTTLLGPWWEKAFDPDRVMTHEMLSDVLWHGVMMTARTLRYKYIKFVPRQQNLDRQRVEAMGMILKFQLLERMVSNWRSINLVQSNSDNSRWLRTNLDGMQESFAKRYSTCRVYD